MPDTGSLSMYHLAAHTAVLPLCYGEAARCEVCRSLSGQLSHARCLGGTIALDSCASRTPAATVPLSACPVARLTKLWFEIFRRA